MSWSDIFPVMDDDMLEAFQNQASIEEKREIAHLFDVHSVHNRLDGDHIVSTSLFWKPAFADDPNFPPISKELMQNPTKARLPTRYKNPWEHYFLPILSAATHLKKERPNVTFRVYLANDLQFLLPELIAAGCEVHLMASSSIRHNPGAMWRFLAMEEDRKVTITDSDRSPKVIHDIDRTDEVSRAGLNYWRVPYFIGNDNDGVGSPGTYRTTLACQFGSAAPLPMKLLSEAFIWHCLRGNISENCHLGDRKIPIFGRQWPIYGFDEFFLNTAVFPRIATEGILTFVPWSGSSLNHWFSLDIEYCTWANPKSEIVFYGDPSARPSATTLSTPSLSD